MDGVDGVEGASCSGTPATFVGVTGGLTGSGVLSI